jgi:hypothetical protein
LRRDPASTSTKPPHMPMQCNEAAKVKDAAVSQYAFMG